MQDIIDTRSLKNNHNFSQDFFMQIMHKGRDIEVARFSHKIGYEYYFLENCRLALKNNKQIPNDLYVILKKTIIKRVKNAFKNNKTNLKV